MKRAEASVENVVIRASAGTGKTFQLANRYLGLVSSGQQPDRILAATFARKAAGEITERVLLRLAEAALDPSSGRELTEHLGGPTIPDGRWHELLAEMISRLHRLRIGTLDSFFIQSASSLSLELILPPGWTILDDVDDARLRAEAIRRVLAEGSTADSVKLMHMLSKGAAVRSITQQINELVKDLYDVYRETGPEAWNVLSKMTALTEPEVADALTQLSLLAPCEDNKTIAKAQVASLAAASAADWAAFVSGGIPAKLVQGDTTFARKPITPEQHAAYGPLVKHARAFLVNQWISQTDGARRLLEAFDAVYDQLKFRSRGLRFEDVTRKLAAGLGGRQLASVFYRLDGQIAHLLLDEFQDTSLSQWQVLEHLARACTEPACGRSFFCVGDVKQAIYGWRGGVAEIFDAVDQSLPGVGRQSLTRSFRSSPTVIDVVNRVFGNLAPNEALAEFGSARDAWAARFEPHTTAKEELAGYVCLRTAPRAADKKQQSAGTLSYAAAEIARLAKSHPGRSIGVLVRRNAAVARLIFDLRIHHEVFASEEGGNPLTDSSAVQLVLSLLRLADHPGDGPSRFHVATSPLGPAVGFESHADVSAACQLSQRVRRQLLTDGYGRTIYSWVRALAGHCGQRDLNRLLQLVALAHGYDARATLRTDDFIDYVTDRRVEDPTAADVRVMTVHQAKGLQFDIVVLPELDVDLKGQAPRVVIGRPSPTSPANKVCRYASEELRAMLPEDVQQLFERWPQQSVSESLCLLYVAMTRAIHALHMIIAPSKENEKTWPKTYAGVLRGSLAPGSKAEPERLLDEHGNASWDVTRKPSVVKLAAPSTAPLEVRLRPSTMRRELDRVSPSSLEGGARVDLARKLRPPAAAFERGSLVHAWFEAVEWSDDGIPPEPALREIARKQHFAADKLPGELKKFAAMLARPAIRAALSRAAYDDPKAGPPELKVSRERRFAVRQGDRLVTGAIDRLVEVYRGSQLVTAEILDFKTDAIADAAALAKAVEFYRPQIEAYRNAVASQTGLDRRMVAARLLFVERGECVALEPENVPGVGPK